jgi:hypothetical protein
VPHGLDHLDRSQLIVLALQLAIVGKHDHYAVGGDTVVFFLRDHSR